MPLEIGQSQPRQPGLFGQIDRVGRIARLVRLPGFHLDKHHRPAVDGHQVDFAQRSAMPPGDDVVAAAA